MSITPILPPIAYFPIAPLVLVSPVFVSGASTLSVDSSVLPLVVLGDQQTWAIDVLVGPTTVTLTDPVLVNGQNQFTGQAPITIQPTAQVFQLTGRNYVDSYMAGSLAAQLALPADVNDIVTRSDLNQTFVLVAAPATVAANWMVFNPQTTTTQYELLYLNTQLAVAISPPSGVTIYKGSVTCRVEWALPTFSGFEGVRVQWSTDPSGVTVPYTQFGDLVTDPTRTGMVAISTPATLTASTPSLTQPAQSNVVTTTTVLEAQVQYCSATLPLATVNQNIFYVILTTVIQDPVTNAVYESLAAGPFTCGYVNLKLVNPTDFLALQRTTDIATRIITEMTRRDPDLDLTAHSELRDLVINPLSIELANMSVREWFSRCAQSVSAMAQIDNASGNGISDPVASSPVKQQIARAYGLGTTDVQTFLDQRFDVLGEQAGVQRGGSTTATVSVTFFVYARPLALISVQSGVLVSTIPNAATAAQQFVTTGSGSIDPSNAATYYDPTNNWWSVTVPAQATSAGSAGQVGAGAIRQVTSGGPSGVSCVNQLSAYGGTDQQSNADYAAMIEDRLVTGVDTGSRNGYQTLTLGIPGITDALVVAAGDTDMLRDWSSVIGRHTFGCVDIYARGGSQSQATDLVPFTYQTPAQYGLYASYLAATLLDRVYLRFKITDFAELTSPLYTVVEMVVQSAGRTLWLGKQRAQFDNVNGVLILDPTEYVYVVNQDGSTTVWQIGGVPATNAMVITAVGTQASVTYSVLARYQSGISYEPALQPVFQVDSLVGPLTGAIAAANLKLVYTNDFLLSGGSNDAGDTVTVLATQTIPTVMPLVTNPVASLVAGTAGAPVTIAQGMAVPLNANGVPLNVLSVRSADQSALYSYGVDYTIVSVGPYHTYGISLLAGGAIVPGATVLVAYNSYLLQEQIRFQTDTLTVTGTTPTSLSSPGFIQNSWLPASYGYTALMLDGQGNIPQTGLAAAGVAPAARYIKVTFVNGLGLTVTANQGQDFILTVQAATGTATVARVSGGAIPDGASLQVSYYTCEVFSLTTEYPTYVQQAITAIDAAKHAGADVLVKAMVESPVDITMVVNLASNVTPESVDGVIRTALSIALDNASTTAAQSVLVAQVQAIPGVTSIQLPLVKCAKADGSYIIGSVLTSGTNWIPLGSDASFTQQTIPANAYITANPVLMNQTIPSGGLPNAYVGLLYEGQPYTRCLSIQQFLAASQPSFYVIGTSDQISPSIFLNSTYAGKVMIIVPSTVANPGLQAYRLTYQAFGNAGTGDIVVASPEVLSPGNINLLYSSASA